MTRLKRLQIRVWRFLRMMLLAFGRNAVNAFLISGRPSDGNAGRRQRGHRISALTIPPERNKRPDRLGDAQAI